MALVSELKLGSLTHLSLSLQFLTDVQRFPRDQELPHSYLDDSPWYLVQPGMYMYAAVLALRKWTIPAT